MRLTWTRSTVGEVTTQCDYGLSCGLSTDPGGVPILRMGNLCDGRVSLEDMKYVPAEAVCEKDLLKPGDVLVNRTNSAALVGKVGLFSIDATVTFASYLFRLRTDPTIAHAAWLVQLLGSPRYQARLRELATPGVSQTNINRDVLRGLGIPLPPLDEQRAIAAILSSVDDAVEATQAVIDQLQVVKKALMVELLTQGVSGPHMGFKRTEIGEVPAQWEVCRLDSLAVIQTGIAKGKVVEAGVELPYLRVANVQDGFVDLAEVKTIVVDKSSVDRFRLRPGDVLFTEGGDADKLGRGCVWRGQIDPCLHQNHVFSVRPNKERLRPEFLALWAASPRGKAYFLDCAKQTTNLASINSTQLKALPVPLPTVQVQDEIVGVISSASDRLDAEHAYREQLSAIKSALMSVLLTGEVRVTSDAAAA